MGSLGWRSFVTVVRGEARGGEQRGLDAAELLLAVVIEQFKTALEFGTVPYDDFLDALRADQWLQNHPEAPAELAASIRQGMKDAFYVDADDWKQQVLEQGREVLGQTLDGLLGPR